MKLWRTVLFATLAVALGAYIWFVERPRMEAENEPDRLVRFDADRVSGLRLVYPGEPAIVLSKLDGDWRLTEPLTTDADDTVVSRLVEQIASTEVTRRIEPADAAGLETYGLDGDGAQARVTITLDDGSDLPSVIVGKTTPVGYEAFARVEDSDQVLVIPLLLHSGIKKGVFDLREKKLFTVDAGDATALTLARNGTTIRAAREGDQWKLTEPIDVLADKEQILGLVRSLADLTALAYYDDVRDDRTEFGLDDPKLSFTVEVGGDHGTVGFRLGDETQDAPAGVYLERLGDGQIAKVAAWADVRFAKDTNALRNKELFACDPLRIQRVEYDRGGEGSFSLIHGSDGGWTIEPPAASERPVKVTVAQRTASGLAALAGKDIVAENVEGDDALAAYGLEPPAARVTITNRDGKVCGSALAGVVGADTEAPAYYVKRADGATVMSVPAYLYSRMNMIAEDFLEPPAEPAASD